MASDKVCLKRVDFTYMSIMGLCCYNAFCYRYTGPACSNSAQDFSVPQTADAGVSNRLKKVIQIDVLLTLYELIEFCLLVIYIKPGVVQYIYCGLQVFIKTRNVTVTRRMPPKELV